MDEEECDGLDNDGDGKLMKECPIVTLMDFDCFDVEVCDSLDNDGDGLVDEDARYGWGWCC